MRILCPCPSYVPGYSGDGGLRKFVHPLGNRGMNTEKYLVRHLLSIQQFLEEGDLDNAYWPPGTEHPADGLTESRSEMGPILALLDTGRLQPGLLRPLKGLASRESQSCVHSSLSLSIVFSHLFCWASFVNFSSTYILGARPAHLRHTLWGDSPRFPFCRVLSLWRSVHLHLGGAPRAFISFSLLSF